MSPSPGLWPGHPDRIRGAGGGPLGAVPRRWLIPVLVLAFMAMGLSAAHARPPSTSFWARHHPATLPHTQLPRAVAWPAVGGRAGWGLGPAAPTARGAQAPPHPAAAAATTSLWGAWQPVSVLSVPLLLLLLPLAAVLRLTHHGQRAQWGMATATAEGDAALDRKEEARRIRMALLFPPPTDLTGMVLDEAVLRHFDLLEVSTPRLLACPQLRTCSIDALRATQELLESYFVDVPWAVGVHLPLAFQPAEDLAPLASLLDEAGVMVHRALFAIPRLFDKDAGEVRRLLEVLRTNGIRVGDALNEVPHILNVELPTLQHRLKYLTDLGVDVAVLNATPTALLRPSYYVAAVARRLTELGLAAPAVLAASPQVLVEDWEAGVLRRVRYLTKKIGAPVSAINGFPAYLGLPFRSVIRARYEYLRHLGRPGPLPLRTVLQPADLEFARRVADSTFEAYMTWRSKRTWLEEAPPPRPQKQRGRPPFALVGEPVLPR
eukprot:EG_transcript_8533